ncbi:hypothetical protein ACFLRY_00030 [Bacteroidota bacterium]
MKKALLFFLLLAVFVSCKKDDDTDETNSPYEEFVYKGTTHQNQDITIKVQGNLITGIKTKFEFNLPLGTNIISIDLYDSDGIASFINNTFTYTFPEPSDNESIKQGSKITGTLETIRINGNYNITLKDNIFSIQGDYETKLY